MDEVKKYVLLDVEKLTDIDKSIILVVGDNIKNVSIPGLGHGQVKSLETTIQLLMEQNNINEIIKGLSLLYLKDLIGLTSYDPRTIENQRMYWATNVSRTDNLLAFLGLVNDKLRKSRFLLKADSEILLKAKDKVDPEKNGPSKVKPEIIIKIKEGLKKVGDIYSEALYNEITRLDTESPTEEVIINLDGNIEIANLFLNIYDVKNDPEKILEQIIEKFFDSKKIQEVKYVYLTTHNYGTNGIHIYDYVQSPIRDDLKQKIKELEQKVNDIEKKEDDIENHIEKTILKRNIEIISIFVAIITLIIGNVSFLPKISVQTTIGAISIILIVNGSLISGVTVMMVIVSRIIKSEINCKCVCIILSIIVGVTLAVGILLPIADKYWFKTEIQTNKEEPLYPDIQNGLTIENNINATNEGAQPTVTISPEVSIEVQPTPTPAPTPVPTQT